jgi:hypothetical protein
MEFFLIIFYFLPTIIAAIRKNNNIGQVAVINVFLGWTGIGWIIALAMAAGNGRSSTTIVINNENVLGDAKVVRREADAFGDGSQTQQPQPGPIKQALAEAVSARFKPSTNGATTAAPKPQQFCADLHPVPAGSSFCPVCGQGVGSRCKNGHVVDLGDFCNVCGIELVRS